MSYVGGKAKGSDFILDVLNNPIFDGYPYMEPFVGYCHILRRVSRKREYRASDNNPLLLCLLKAIQDGEPIPHVTRQEYASLKSEKGVNLRRAAAAFTYSFNGKEFGGYVDKYCRKGGRVDDIPLSRRKYYKTLSQTQSFQNCSLECADYRDMRPHGKLIYCDPPYHKTQGYGKETFCSAEFWEVMRDWSRNNIVFISEYDAPPDFKSVGCARKMCCLAGGQRQKQRTEKLFLHESSWFHASLSAVTSAK